MAGVPLYSEHTVRVITSADCSCNITPQIGKSSLVKIVVCKKIRVVYFCRFGTPAKIKHCLTFFLLNISVHLIYVVIRYRRNFISEENSLIYGMPRVQYSHTVDREIFVGTLRRRKLKTQIFFNIE